MNLIIPSAALKTEKESLSLFNSWFTKNTYPGDKLNFIFDINHTLHNDYMAYVSIEDFNIWYGVSNENNCGFLRLTNEYIHKHKTYEDSISNANGIILIKPCKNIMCGNILINENYYNYLYLINKKEKISFIPVYDNSLKSAYRVNFNIVSIISKNNLDVIYINKERLDDLVYKKYMYIPLINSMKGCIELYVEDLIDGNKVRINMYIDKEERMTYILKTNTKINYNNNNKDQIQILSSYERIKELPKKKSLEEIKEIKEIKEVMLNEIDVDANQITDINLDFKLLGIGALNQQMTEIIRAVLSRAVSEEARIKLGIKGHEKGILLYGCPGTGKTLIARELAGILNVSNDRFKVVNGPEVISKYVGESEENIRNLFNKAKYDSKQLYIIFFDEFDSIASIRSSGNSAGENVGNRIVNQLLTMMDGVEQIDNVLIIASTNRKDMIDPALLRPGRFGVLIKIGLPDDEGRKDIFHIHLKEAIEHNALNKDVDINILVQRTLNFSGAEIKGLCDRARSLALQESLHINNNVITQNDLNNINIDTLCIKYIHFEEALKQINPIFGQYINISNKIIFNIPSQQDLINKIKYKLSVTTHNKPTTIVIQGCPQNGKSVIVHQIAEQTKDIYDYIKIISPSIHNFKDVFDKLWYDIKSVKKSLIILENLECLLNILNQHRYDEKILTYFNNIINSTITNHIVFIITINQNSLDLFNIINPTVNWSSIYKIDLPDNHDIKALLNNYNYKYDLTKRINNYSDHCTYTIGQILNFINVTNADNWTEQQWVDHFRKLEN